MPLHPPFRRARRTLSPIAGLAFALLATSMGTASPAPASAQDLDSYHTYDELTSELRGLVDAASNVARLSSIARTGEGRDLWLVELANPSGTPVGERPALFVSAGFEGDDLVGSALALAMVRQLTERYGSDPGVTEALDQHVIYVVPRANPDGAEKAFGALETWSTTNARAVDDDNDGRTDEDGPDDLNGDGVVTFMRVREGDGRYMLDPEDPRLLRVADAASGERGEYAIYWEGLDDDGDGFYNEDPPGGVDPNRNFQHEYPYYTVGAGPHMVSEPEVRGILDFVIAHRNIAAFFTFSRSDNLIAAPQQSGALASASSIDLKGWADASNESARSVGMFSTGGGFGFGFGGGGGQGGGGGGGQRPATTINRADLDYFTRVSERYRELTGIERAMVTREPRGAFFQYGYYQFGVPSFVTPGWGTMDSGGGGGGARPGGGGGSSTDARLLEWMGSAGVDGFVEWTPFEHPTLGAVEIGGFKPYAATNPPFAAVAELGRANSDFAVWLTSVFPEVRVAETEVTDHGGGIFRIEAEVENAGWLPTSTQHGVVCRCSGPVMVQLGVDPDRIVTGNDKTEYIQKLDGSGRRERFVWVVRGQAGQTIELKVRAAKAGTHIATITLR